VQAEGPSLESVPATARRHGFSANTLYRWIRDASVPDRLWVQLGGRYYVRRRSFAEWLDMGEPPADLPRPTPLRAVG
jgi:transposase-like protein